ncbi:hypothetical protein JDO7802_02244 [Jannaschia donghaensis]|uniref:Uncharacterized protein n=1 Tax=Jannaschia donghaensis TaxID=420998 RepID=A0A0M6YKM6_9RHOB|nr:hypothetical protein JDO7802_02244 [Jannaschia donghaensis]
MKSGRLIAVLALVTIGALSGAFGFWAGTLSATASQMNGTVVTREDGVIQGEITVGDVDGISPEGLARLACAPHSELRVFEITHAVLATQVYQFDCTAPGKVTQ